MKRKRADIVPPPPNPISASLSSSSAEDGPDRDDVSSSPSTLRGSRCGSASKRRRLSPTGLSSILELFSTKETLTEAESLLITSRVLCVEAEADNVVCEAVPPACAEPETRSSPFSQRRFQCQFVTSGGIVVTHLSFAEETLILSRCSCGGRASSDAVAAADAARRERKKERENSWRRWRREGSPERPFVSVGLYCSHVVAVLMLLRERALLRAPKGIDCLPVDAASEERKKVKKKKTEAVGALVGAGRVVEDGEQGEGSEDDEESDDDPLEEEDSSDKFPVVPVPVPVPVPRPSLGKDVVSSSVVSLPEYREKIEKMSPEAVKLALLRLLDRQHVLLRKMAVDPPPQAQAQTHRGGEPAVGLMGERGAGVGNDDDVVALKQRMQALEKAYAFKVQLSFLPRNFLTLD